jgi:hypothetical protein
MQGGIYRTVQKNLLKNPIPQQVRFVALSLYHRVSRALRWTFRMKCHPPFIIHYRLGF